METTMLSFTLTRSGLPPLVFLGKQVGEVAGKWHDGKEANRWHDLAVYRTRGGKYVASVVYRTQWQGESDYHSAKVFNEPAGVVEWFRIHNLLANVRGFPPGDAYAEKQKRLEDDLHRRYEARLTELYDQLGDEFAEGVD